MSFTIKCDKCGNERKIEQDSRREENDIEIWGQYNFDVGFDCWKCKENDLTIKG